MKNLRSEIYSLKVLLVLWICTLPGIIGFWTGDYIITQSEINYNIAAFSLYLWSVVVDYIMDKESQEEEV